VIPREDASLSSTCSRPACPTDERVAGHHGEILACAFIPKQPYVISSGSDGRILLWDAALQQVVAAWQASDKAILSCAISPDGGRLLTGSLDGLLAQWDLATHRRLSIFLAHPRPISGITFSPDGRYLATSSWDGSVLLRKAHGEGKPTTLYGHRDIVAGCRFTADSKRLLSWSYDASLRLWDAQWGRSITQWNGHGDRITAGDASPDGQWLATAGQDGHVILWDAHRGQEVARYDGAGTDVIACLFSPDAELLFVCSKGGEITTLSVPELGSAVVEETGVNIQAAALSRTGETLVIGTSHGNCHFLPAAGGAGRSLCVTAYETDVNRPGFLRRLLRIEKLHRVRRCRCPICGREFDVEPALPAPRSCPHCGQAVKVNSFTSSEPPSSSPATGSSGTEKRTPTFYPSQIDQSA
jgi:WD40 repeat protein